MSSLSASLIDFQIALVDSLRIIAAIGLIFVAFGYMISPLSAMIGYRVRRLGVQILGACVLVLMAHIVLLDAFGPTPPASVIIGLYTLVSLLLLQGFINLIFGPDVGSRVIADLLSTLFHGLVFLFVKPFGALRYLFRRW